MNPDERLQYVRVTNGLDFDFVDRYDGVPVTIPPGKSENLPADMAAHFFGVSLGADRAQVFKHVSKRHGWNTVEFLQKDPVTGKSKAETYFDKLEIKAVSYKLVPAEEAPASNPNAPVPADPGLEDEEERDDGRRPDGTFKPKTGPRMTAKRVEVNI